MTFQDVQKHLDGFSRPAGFDIKAWRIYKKMALLIWESYLTGARWDGIIKVPCREFFFMLHDKQGRLIVRNPELLVWLDNQWNNALVANMEKRGIEHARVGAHTQAESYFNRVLNIFPKRAVAFNHRGWVRQQQGDFRAALADYSKAIDLNPMDDAAYVNRAALYSLMDMDSKAMDDLNRAIALNPDNGSAYSNRGNILNARNEKDSAMKDLKKAARLSRKGGNFYETLDDNGESKTAA